MGTEPIEAIICSFIIKIWLEEAATEENEAVWRGRITHVPSGERRFFQDLNELPRFIETYIEQLNNKKS